MRKINGFYIFLFIIFFYPIFEIKAESKCELSFTRYYNYEELTDALKKLTKAYPEFLKLESIGKSYQQRDIWAVTINNPQTGPKSGKAAMYIHANIHGNEIQGAEVCLYTIWYLMEKYSQIEQITELVDQRVFYILPSVNPDGRAHWFDAPNTSNSSRGGQKPTDNDRDWLLDEDGLDDLDGDGEILQMRKRDPEGRYRIHPEDSRRTKIARDDQLGEYTYLGMEGIDNDGDGKINEDGPGGYDPNRNWPSDWRPNYQQYGAGDYPLSLPESQAVASFILARPNIAGVQGYHNFGGMILRGPGATSSLEYHSADKQVYKMLGEKGELILPFYRYMVLYKDLYSVYGGFVTWAFEDLGIFSFTNELFSSDQYFKNSTKDSKLSWRQRYEKGSENRLRFNDLVEFRHLFVAWKPFQHPTYGEIEIGGWKKYARRVNPEFMLPELCHRNCAFTLFHAQQMPLPEIKETTVEKLKSHLYRIRIGLTNQRLIPTISKNASDHQLQPPDVVTLSGPQAKVISAGRVENRWRNKINLVKARPERIVLAEGLRFKNIEWIEWIVSGSGEVVVQLDCVKGGVVRQTLKLN